LCQNVKLIEVNLRIILGRMHRILLSGPNKFISLFPLMGNHASKLGIGDFPTPGKILIRFELSIFENV